jgi:hypothetical protein
MNARRISLFLFGCIGTRSLLVVLAKEGSKTVLKNMGYIAVLIGLGFVTIYLTGSRKRGAEVFGEKIWWNDLRPLHGSLYLLFGYNAIKGNKNSWKILLLDVVIGLISYVYHHHKKGEI